MVGTIRRHSLAWTTSAGVFVAIVVFAMTYISGSLPNRDQTQGIEHTSSASLIPRPKSTNQLVNDTDAIVIGTVGTVVREGLEGPYNAEALIEDSRDVPTPGLLHFTYFELEVQEVLLKDRASQTDGTYVIRVNGRSTREATFGDLMPMPEKGERFLFFLRKNPDGRSYGHWGPWGRLNIDGETLRFSDWEQSPVNFTDKKDPDAFLAELRQRVNIK